MVLDQQRSDLFINTFRPDARSDEYRAVVALIDAEPDRASQTMVRREQSLLRGQMLDQIEIETLDSILAESRGKTPQSVAVAIETRFRTLAKATGEDGVGLATIHGSKGREWNRVVLYG